MLDRPRPTWKSPLRKATLPPLAACALAGALALLAGAALAGCDRAPSPPPSGSAASSSSSAAPSEAARTRDLDQKAKDYQQRAQDVQNMQGTEQEKIDAVNKLEQQRQDLNRQSEGAPAPADSSSTPSPQPPPL